MQKKAILEHLKLIAKNVKEMGKPFTFKPSIIPYKTEGSKFAEDTIRITGSPEFIDSVLSRLANDILPYENLNTRLQISYQESTDRQTQAKTGSYVCYIQFHERGGEAKMANAIASSLAKKPVIISAGY